MAQFLGHGVRSGIPNSLDRSINWKKLIDIRAAQHHKRVSKPGKSSKEIYKVGEEVLVQNIKSKLWDQREIISEMRLAHDGRIVSYELEVNGHNKYEA